MPTLLDLLGFELPAQASKNLAGRSLIPMIEADAEQGVAREFVVCETNDYGVTEEEQTVAIRSTGSKLILNNWRMGGRDVFDLTKDPNERHPLPGPLRDEKIGLAAHHRTWRERTPSPSMVKSIELDESTRRGLKSLGYLRDE